MANKTVLAVDVGSTTISAAIAGGNHTEPRLLHPARETAVWPAQVNVAADGSLDCDAAQATTIISRFTRLLGREAQVIAGFPRHADALVAAALTPALRSARATLGSNTVDVVAATFPATWPGHIVEAYRRAIEKFAPGEAQLIPWHEAIAAQTYPPDPYVDCPVTSLDFGARSASVTMVRVDPQGRTRSLYSVTHPTAGFASVARAVVHEVAIEKDVDLSGCDEVWWDTAIAAVAAGRSEATRNAANIVRLMLPAPVNPVAVSYDEITDLFAERLNGVDRVGVIQALVERSPVQKRWTLPGNPLAARPIVQLTGGFAEDPAVQATVRHILNAEVLVVDQPAHAAAWGAAKLTFEGR
ncbi:hypothetical protein [Gordonia alkanivorans]|uniref:hypothetical protein n=1 Tax=Gordonia alkanivorans TaxID=84096 RepID=UPI0004B22AE5|nr:hypothetical protein [Gordonia alkanivorans]